VGNSQAIAVTAEQPGHETAIGLEVVDNENAADAIRDRTQLLSNGQRRSHGHGSLIGRRRRQT
jgi:hypothetical protein